MSRPLRTRAPVKKRPWRIARKLAKRGGWMQCRGPTLTPLVEVLRAMLREGTERYGRTMAQAAFAPAEAPE